MVCWSPCFVRDARSRFASDMKPRRGSGHSCASLHFNALDAAHELCDPLAFNAGLLGSIQLSKIASGLFGRLRMIQRLELVSDWLA